MSTFFCFFSTQLQSTLPKLSSGTNFESGTSQIESGTELNGTELNTEFTELSLAPILSLAPVLNLAPILSLAPVLNLAPN